MGLVLLAAAPALSRALMVQYVSSGEQDVIASWIESQPDVAGVHVSAGDTAPSQGFAGAQFLTHDKAAVPAAARTPAAAMRVPGGSAALAFLEGALPLRVSAAMSTNAFLALLLLVLAMLVGCVYFVIHARARAPKLDFVGRRSTWIVEDSSNHLRGRSGSQSRSPLYSNDRSCSPSDTPSPRGPRGPLGGGGGVGRSSPRGSPRVGGAVVGGGMKALHHINAQKDVLRALGRGPTSFNPALGGERSSSSSDADNGRA